MYSMIRDISEVISYLKFYLNNLIIKGFTIFAQFNN